MLHRAFRMNKEACVQKYLLFFNFFYWHLNPNQAWIYCALFSLCLTFQLYVIISRQQVALETACTEPFCPEPLVCVREIVCQKRSPPCAIFGIKKKVQRNISRFSYQRQMVDVVLMKDGYCVAHAMGQSVREYTVCSRTFNILIAPCLGNYRLAMYTKLSVNPVIQQHHLSTNMSIAHAVTITAALLVC